MLLRRLLALALVAGLVAGGWQVGPPSIPPARLLVVGDSITAGYGASVSAVTGYAPLVASALGVSATAGIYGYPGADSSQVLADVPAAALTAPHTLVVLETGTNDWDNSTPAQFASAYAALVSAASATLTGSAMRPLLLCLTLWHDPAQLNAYGLTVVPYNAVIAATPACSRTVDITTLYTNPAYHSQSGPDTFHPNDAGHAAIAQAILAA